MRPKILIIEDEKIMRITLEDSLRTNGYEVSSFEKGQDGLNAFKEDNYSLVITDVKLPDIDGLEVTRKIKNINERVQVIIITAFGTIKHAVEAMKLGAYDYITKPFSLDELNLIIERGLDVKGLREENIRLRKELSGCFCYPNIIGESAEMKKVFEFIGKVARTDLAVLILGESGTGKELVASTIHYQGGRRDSPLIKVNCAALPDGLIESELFGYEKGAFTGAANRKPGRFELADGGTIFLDEVGELPPSTQVKLLRVLQDGSFERLGGRDTLKVDIRVISATNSDLEEYVKKGKFREDLYYRLNVIPFEIPPLRKKREDIPLLLEHFINRTGRQVRFSTEAIRILMAYDFPGNIRELENIVERSIALSDSEVIEKEDIPPNILNDQNIIRTSPLSLSEIAREAEKEHIRKVIKSTKGNKTKAAEILGISRKTLWEKMTAYSMN